MPGSDALSLTLPKAASQSRRRRLPRPPKFTKRQMVELALLVLIVVGNIVSGWAAEPSGMAMTSYWAVCIREVFMEAIHGWSWHLSPQGRKSRQLRFALLVASVAAVLGEAVT